MEFRSFISAVTYDGRFVKDLTNLCGKATYGRSLSDVSGASVEIPDISNGLFGELNFMEHSLRFEAEYADGSKELTWEGPISDMPKVGGATILASDLGMFWDKVTIFPDGSFDGDSSDIAHSVLDQSLSVNRLGLPRKVDVRPSMFFSDVKVKAGTVIKDFLGSLTGLEYCFVGKRLFLFGSGGLDERPLVLNNRSWVDRPVVEQIYKYYANQVVVVGRNNILGVASNGEADRFVVSRRFDYPELSTQAQVDSRAEALLRKVERKLYIDFDSSVMLRFNNLDLKINDFVPGRRCVVSVESEGVNVVDEFLLSSVEVDAIGSSVSVGLVPLGRVEGG